ncbi:hypothetical protein ACJJTC_005669 [Scirpophaga incertulas]
MAQQVSVRPARPDDMPTVHRLIIDLATHEGVPDGPKLSPVDLIEDGFNTSPPWFFCLVAEINGEIVGYALCNRAYSSWTRRAMYLEDLYVAPAHRRAGVATALLRALCQMAVSEGVNRIDWHVLVGNASAQAFYEQLGARDLSHTEHRAPLRLYRPDIERAAAGH